MNYFLVFIKKIEQIGKSTFEIHWSDDRISVYTLEQLQRACPCMRCRDQEEIQRSDEVSAHKIRNVGRYAIHIDFTSGCSKGIFTYSFLRQLSLGDV